MTTKIPVELSSTPGIVDGSNATAITIDSSERVGVGTASPSHMLHVNAADGASDNTQAMTIENNEATDGRSYGLKIKAGSTANDASLFVQDHDASNDHFIIRGNGNVGIGTTSPAEKLSINNASGNAYLQCISGNGNLGGVWIGDQADNFVGGFFYDNAVDASLFYVNNAERMRIAVNGELVIGRTAVVGPGVVGDTNSTEIGRGYINLDRDDTASVDQILFGKNGSIAGRITTTSSTTYTTTSDYRKKENVTPVVKGLERVQKLNPVSYTWIDDEVKVVEEGFLAHEVQEAGWETGVNGEKDGEDTQSMDYGRITPLLVKAIQEQQEQIEQLKTEIQTLKGE